MKHIMSTRHPYVPNKLPLDGLNYQLLFSLVGDANGELARYDGLLQGIPNPAILLSPLTTREAVLSSKIEGTQATVDEVLEQEAGLIKEGEKYKDIQEISNYRLALFQASDHLLTYPIRLSVLREIHKVLLNSVRGKDKTPGYFRVDQNWIGKAGCSIEEASFVPPDPVRMNDFLGEWEIYLDYEESDILLQTAVMHAQFELIHPFKDGNGRIGRILIPLFLFYKKKLSQPMFYLSEYLESHRDEYYRHLRGISEDRNWNDWIAFFLKAVAIQAKENSAKVKSIMALYEKMKQQIHDITHSQYAVFLLDSIFKNPIFRTSDCANKLHKRHGIHRQTTLALLRQLKAENVLIELQKGVGRRAATLCFKELINLAEGKQVL